MAFIHIVLLYFTMITVAEAAQVQYLKQFFKVQNAGLYDGNSLKEMMANAEICSKTCFEDKQCLSFDVKGSGPSCKLYSEDSRDRGLIRQTGSNFYQLVRDGLNRAEYETCPIDVVYDSYIVDHNDIDQLETSSFTDCLQRFLSNPKCRSIEYSGKSCYLSSDSFGQVGVLNTWSNWTYFEKNETRWKKFLESHTLYDINTVGCGIRNYESYFMKDYVRNETLKISTEYTLRRNPYEYLVTYSTMVADSTTDCGYHCSFSETCIAFSYSNNTCHLKKLS